MLGSLFSGRRDYTKVIKRAPVQTEPFETDVAGFNTRFSRYDLECKEKWGWELTPAERKFLDHVRSL